MTMVNVPALVFFFVVLVVGFYGLLAGGIWVLGRLTGSAGAQELGSHLASGAAGVFLGYTLLLIAWFSLLPGGGTLGYRIGSGLLLGAPFVIVLPPIWVVIQHFVGED